MHNWFECKIRYEKVMENGMNKKVTEPYLVDALSFTEAEARIIEEITPYISGEFTVSDIKRAHYRIGTGFRSSRCCKETGRRNERYNGRLSDRIRSRNRHHGCISV